jgi:hypothetical protein
MFDNTLLHPLAAELRDQWRERGRREDPLHGRDRSEGGMGRFGHLVAVVYLPTRDQTGR